MTLFIRVLPIKTSASNKILSLMTYNNKELSAIGPLDPLLVGRAHIVYARAEHNNQLSL
jgi:hypothetical protein